MEAVAIHGAVMVGKSFFCRMIYDMYDLIKDHTHHPYVRKVLKDLDLEADLRVVEALMNEIEDKRTFSPTSLIGICLQGVHQVVSDIKGELEEIKKVTEEHQEKYFHKWRTPHYDVYLDNIRDNTKILDKRMDMLIKMLNLRS